MVSLRFRHVVAALACYAGAGLQPLGAQVPAGRPVGDASRAELEQRARLADSLGRKEEAFVLRARLRDGDFEIGDRIAVKYEGPGLTRDDTLVVQSGRMIRLGEPMGDLNLSGVLRFEVQGLIATRIDQLFKNEIVRVMPLLRVSISGAVRQPGIFHVRPDALLSDVIMRNAGLDPTADLRNTTIKRGVSTLWTAADVQSAIANGLTVEGLGLEPGDEIAIAARPAAGTRWMLLAQYGLPILTSVILALAVRRH
jgi:hypothetical protein